MSGSIYVDSTGLLLEFKVVSPDTKLPINLTSVVDVKLIIMKPNGVTAIKSVPTVGLDSTGIVRYYTVTDDLNQSGQYRVQLEITFLSSKTRSEIKVFSVLPNL